MKEEAQAEEEKEPGKENAERGRFGALVTPVSFPAGLPLGCGGRGREDAQKRHLLRRAVRLAPTDPPEKRKAGGGGYEK